MPLIKGKSEKSFVKNMKTEMEHGKPQKQSLAIAYAMKRKAQKAKKMADGGDVQTQQGPDLPGAQSFQDAFRKSTKYAEGGKVDLDKRISESRSKFPNEENKGVHAESYSREKQGQSEAGNTYRNVKGVGGGYEERGRAAVKGEHEKRLGELKSMPKPKLQGLAEGGYIEDNYQDPSYRWHQTKDGDVNHREMDSGYMSHEGNMQRPDEMAMMEDDKRLNQHPVDMHAETSMEEQDLVDRIMELRSKTFESEARNYSEGGKVANEDEIEAGFDPNEFDVLHLEDDLESTYGDDDNAGDSLGNKGEDARRSDLVDRIMLKNFKQKYPRGYPGR